MEKSSWRVSKEHTLAIYRSYRRFLSSFECDNKSEDYYSPQGANEFYTQPSIYAVTNSTRSQVAVALALYCGKVDILW